MYVPPAFAQNDLPTLHSFIERHSFGLLVSSIEKTPFGSHLPILLRRNEGPHGTLVGHMARANPHWQEIVGQTALVVFTGPHTYISPTWYEAPNVVPTWNFTAVHVTGTVEIFEGHEELRSILQETVQVYEQSMPNPWSFDDSGTFAERMMAQIVGFRIPIERIEGKFKLSQNQPVERRAKVVRALEQQTGENAQQVARLMRESLGEELR
jgi:transcriptional regulator